MLEYPESYTIARQMGKVLLGKTVASGEYVNPNANIFNPEGVPGCYHHGVGGTVSAVTYCAPDIFITLDNGYGVLFRQGGGKIRYYDPLSGEPGKYNYRFAFSDGSGLTYSVQLWSYGVDVIDHAAWASRVRSGEEMRFQPLDGSFEEYMAFVKSHMDDPKQAIKAYLTKSMAGIMSTFAGEILLQGRIHPAVHIGKLDGGAHKRIYNAMHDVLTRACEMGGRTSEYDLYGHPGGYRAMSERKHIGAPCPFCGNPLEKASVGGITACCQKCQVKSL